MDFKIIVINDAWHEEMAFSRHGAKKTVKKMLTKQINRGKIHFLIQKVFLGLCYLYSDMNANAKIFATISKVVLFAIRTVYMVPHKPSKITNQHVDVWYNDGYGRARYFVRLIPDKPVYASSACSCRVNRFWQEQYFLCLNVAIRSLLHCLIQINEIKMKFQKPRSAVSHYDAGSAIIAVARIKATRDADRQATNSFV